MLHTLLVECDGAAGVVWVGAIAVGEVVIGQLVLEGGELDLDETRDVVREGGRGNESHVGPVVGMTVRRGRCFWRVLEV